MDIGEKVLRVIEIVACKGLGLAIVLGVVFGGLAALKFLVGMNKDLQVLKACEEKIQRLEESGLEVTRSTKEEGVLCGF